MLLLFTEPRLILFDPLGQRPLIELGFLIWVKIKPPLWTTREHEQREMFSFDKLEKSISRVKHLDKSESD
jgi:hypothetical protein